MAGHKKGIRRKRGEEQDCHRCKTAAAIAAGKFRGVAWSKTPCSKCKYRDTEHNHGRSHMPYDELSQGEGGNGAKHGYGSRPCQTTRPLLESDRLKSVPAEPFPESPADETLIERMGVVMRAFLRLDPKTREIVMDRMADPYAPIRSIATRLRLPLSTVHDHLKRARKDWPALAAAVHIAERSGPAAAGGKLG